MALNIISEMELDMARPGANIVHAKQYDSSGRVVRLHLLSDGEPWTVPSDAYPVVRYSKSDRKGGFYDTDENGIYAISYPFENDHSYVDVILALQALTTATASNIPVRMELNLYNADAIRLSSFGWNVLVEPSALSDSKIVSSDYFNALTDASARVIAETADIIAGVREDAAAAKQAKEYAQAFTGAPRAASTAAKMTDHSLIYVYTGNESGYTNGKWYYWNGSAWTIGGDYNSTALTTDRSLSIAGEAADAASTGILKNAVDVIPILTGTFTLGKSINGNNGAVTTGTTSAISSFLTVNELMSGASICFTGDKTDANDVNYLCYVHEYSAAADNKWLRRKLLLASDGTEDFVTVSSDAKYIRLVFGRAGSTGITMTTNDLQACSLAISVSHDTLVSIDKTGGIPIEFNKPYCAYNLAGSTGSVVDVSNLDHLLEPMRSAIVPCSAGDVFTLNVGNVLRTDYRGWAFLDSSYKIIVKATVDFSTGDIVAPTGAAYLVINSFSRYDCYIGHAAKVKSIQEDTNELVKSTYGSEVGGWTDFGQKAFAGMTVGTTVDLNDIPFRGSTAYKLNIIETEPGKIFTIWAKGTEYIRPMIILDDTYTVIFVTTQTDLINYTMVMPVNAAYLILQTYDVGICISGDSTEQNIQTLFDIGNIELIDDLKITIGKYLDADTGEIQESAPTSFITDAFEPNGTYMTFKNYSSYAWTIFIYMYGDDEYIGRLQFSSRTSGIQNSVLRIPECKTVRIAGNRGVNISLAQVRLLRFYYLHNEDADGKRMYDDVTLSDNTYISDKGESSENDIYWSTGYIPVFYGQKICFLNRAIVNAYSSNNKAYLKSRLYFYNSTIWDVPYGINYIRCVFRHDIVDFGGPTMIDVSAGIPSAITEKLHNDFYAYIDLPDSYGKANAIARANQMANIRYTPVATLPNQSGNQIAGKEYQGLPYSSVRALDNFIGVDLSIYTFMTAVKNPRSVLYTRISTASNSRTYYGTVCSELAHYALNLSLPYKNTSEIEEHPKIHKRKNPYGIQVGDVLMKGSTDEGGHTMLITGLKKDNYGRILGVVISESVPPNIRRNEVITFDTFVRGYIGNGYGAYAYDDIDYVDYTRLNFTQGYADEKVEDLVYPDIMPEYGDQACVEAGTDVVINVINPKTYTRIEIYKNNKILDIKDTISDFTMSDMAYGTYRFVITDGENSSESKMIVADAQGSYNESTHLVTFSSANAEPIGVAGYMNSGGNRWQHEFTDAEKAAGQIDITPYLEDGVPNVRVYFGTSYGTAVWYSKELHLWAFL
jgi:hypothetical protein